MSRVLYIDGVRRRDGTLNILPPRAWIPAWDGGTRPNPGDSISYIADSKSGVLRPVQRPFGVYQDLPVAHFDQAELASPLGELSRPGILFENDDTDGLTAGDWDLDSWTKTACTVTTGQTGPSNGTTGFDEAFLLIPSTTNGRCTISRSVTNTNSTTYVFGAWSRKPSGAGNTSLSIIGLTTKNETFAVTDDLWHHYSMTTKNENATTLTLQLYPGGVSGDTSTALFWGPSLVNTGASAGTAGRKQGTSVQPGETRVRSALQGPFAWPSAPWTLYTVFTPLWRATDGLNHVLWRTLDSSGSAVLTFAKDSSSDLGLGLTNRYGASIVAEKAPSISQRGEYRVVLKGNVDGSIQGWLNEAVFSTVVAAPNGFMANDSVTLEIGGPSGSEGDFILHRLEIWDEDIPANKFFGVH